MAFTAELAGYGDRVHIVPRDVHGRLDLPRWLGQPRPGVRVYCCGPAPLLAAVQQFCAEWPEHSLRTERFVPLQVTAPARDQPFQVELRRTGATVTVTPGATVTVTPGTTVLDAVQSAGVSVLSSCRRGLCGTCETGVLAGQPDHRDSLLDDEERMRGDCMFICVSRSRGARLVLDL
jgi:ferredoxin